MVQGNLIFPVSGLGNIAYDQFQTYNYSYNSIKEKFMGGLN